MTFYSPGPELDRAIAEQVFGWEVSDNGKTYIDPFSSNKEPMPLPPFSTDAETADLVRKRVDSRGGWQWGPATGAYRVEDRRGSTTYLLRHQAVANGEWLQASARNPATALCHAVIKAVEAGAEFRPRR